MENQPKVMVGGSRERRTCMRRCGGRNALKKRGKRGKKRIECLE